MGGMTGLDEQPMSKSCPVCGLLSPAIATRCDCGHDFSSGLGGRKMPRLRLAVRRVMESPPALFFIGGAFAVTAATLWQGPAPALRDTLAVAVPWVVGSVAMGLLLGGWMRSAGTRVGTALRGALLMAVVNVMACCGTSIYNWWYAIAHDHRQIAFDVVGIAKASLMGCLTPRVSLLTWLAAMLGALIGGILARQPVVSRRQSLARVGAFAAAAATALVLLAADFTYQGPYLRHFIQVRFAEARGLAGQPEANVARAMGPATWTAQYWDQVMSGTLEPAPGAKFLTVYSYAPYPIHEDRLRWLAPSDRIVVACAEGRVVRVGCSARLRFVRGKVYPACVLSR